MTRYGQQVFSQFSGSQNIDFLNTVGGFTCTRASVATYFNQAGTNVTVGPNVARYNYTNGVADGLLLEEQRTNLIPNSTMVGASAPSTAPTGWTLSVVSGLTTTISTATVNGLNGIAVRLVGTPSGSPFIQAFMTPTTSVAAAQNDTFSLSSYLAITAGSTTNITSITQRLLEYNGSGSIVATDVSSNLLTVLTATATRQLYEGVVVQAATAANVRPLVAMSWTSGAIDVTLFIAAPQLEKARTVSSFIPTTSAAVTRAADGFVQANPPWFKPTGNLSIQFKLPQLPAEGTKATLVQLDSGADTANSRLWIYVEDGRVRVAGNTQYTSIGSYVAGTVATAEISWDGTFIAGQLNGGQTYDLVDATAANFTNFRIGSQVSGSSLNGYMRQIVFSPVASLIPVRTQLVLNSEFSMFPYNAYLAATGQRSVTGYNFDSQRPTGGVAYYVSVSGSDANSGLTPQLPLRTMNAALAKADIGRMALMSPTFDRSAIPSGVNVLARDLVIEGYNGITSTMLGCDQNVSWASDPTYPNVYSRTRNSVLGVVDAAFPTVYGYPTEYTKVASVAAVSALAGSWYNDGTTQSVRTLDDRPPDNSIYVQLQVTGFWFVGGFKLWMENVNTPTVPFFTVRSNGTGVVPELHCRNVNQSYSNMAAGSQLDGLRLLGIHSYLTFCTSALNGLDGFNYHLFEANQSFSYEIGCIGRLNGTTGLSNNNGSTTHDGNTAIRLNGQYYLNQGPNVADVNNNTVTLNLTCACTEPTNTASFTRNYDVGNGSAKQYLANCTSTGPVDYDLNISTGVGATIRYFGDQTFSYNPAGDAPVRVTDLSNLLT